MDNKAIWLSDTSRKKYKVTIGTDEYNEEYIIEENLSITEVLEDNDQLTFSGCRAAKLVMDVRYLSSDNVGKPITVVAYAELGENTSSEYTLFKGTIYSIEQKDNDDIFSSILAYDCLASAINLDVASWYKGLSFPITLAAFRTSLSSFLSNIGISLSTREMPLDDLIIEQTVNPSELSLKDVLSAIAGLNGVFFYANNGAIDFVALQKFKLSELCPAEDLYPSDDLYPGDSFDNADEHIELSHYRSLKYQNYDVASIDKVVIRQDADDIGAIYGDGTNAYVVEGNFMVFGKSAAALAEVAQEVYEIVKDIVYTPAKITCCAMPWLSIGSIVRVNSQKNVIYTYVLEKTYKGVKAPVNIFESEQTETRSLQINTVNESIIRLRGKANKLTRDVERMTSAIYDEEGNSKIEQTAESVAACVTKTGGDASSFSWELLPDGFVLKAGNTEVFRANAQGITINGYATASQLNAVSGRVGTLETDALTAANIDSKTFTLGQGHIQNLTTDYMEVNNWTSSGYIKAEKISAKSITTIISNASSISAKNLTIADGGVIFMYYNGTSTSYAPRPITIGGKSGYILASPAFK